MEKIEDTIKLVYKTTIVYRLLSEHAIYHRIDGPAIITIRYQFWCQHGKLHRIDGPAKIFTNGTKEWYCNGLCHREDGPAIERHDESLEWWILGRKISFNEWLDIINCPDEERIKRKLVYY